MPQFINPAWIADLKNKFQRVLDAQGAMGDAYFAAQAADNSVTTAQTQLGQVTMLVGTLQNPADGVAIVAAAEQRLSQAQANATAAHSAANSLRAPLVQAEIDLINMFGSVADGAHNPVGSGGGEIVQAPILPSNG